VKLIRKAEPDSSWVGWRVLMKDDSIAGNSMFQLICNTLSR